MNSDRLAELESRLAFQDDTIDTLNSVVVGLRDQIERLDQELSRLRAQMLAVQPSAVSGDGNEPPPHY